MTCSAWSPAARWETVCVCVRARTRVCIPACVHSCVCSTCSRQEGALPLQPYQLDDVGDTEPVGLLDVLASFHEAFVALKPETDGVRQAPHSTVGRGQGTRALGQNPVRLEAGPRVLPPGVSPSPGPWLMKPVLACGHGCRRGRPRGPAGPSRATPAGLAGLFIVELTHGRGLCLLSSRATHTRSPRRATRPGVQQPSARDPPRRGSRHPAS